MIKASAICAGVNCSPLKKIPNPITIGSSIPKMGSTIANFPCFNAANSNNAANNVIKIAIPKRMMFVSIEKTVLISSFTNGKRMINPVIVIKKSVFHTPTTFAVF